MVRLPPEIKTKIDSAVERIKLDTGLAYPENSLLDIAEALGAEVVSADLPIFSGKKVKGYIKWNDAGSSSKYRAKIHLNSNQTDVTKTFTLAHELGHFLLHKNLENFFIDVDDYSIDNETNDETEANYFAGSLLMPKNKLQIAMGEAKNISEVAKTFGVSVPAVEARLIWIKNA